MQKSKEPVLEYFVIQHIPTGGFLPSRDGLGLRGGYTNDEPESPRNLAPRLFLDEPAAKRALTWWIKGAHSVRRFKDWLGEYDEEWNLKERPERRAEDMRIVKVCLDLR